MPSLAYAMMGSDMAGESIKELEAEIRRLSDLATRLATCGDFSDLRENTDTFKDAVRIKFGEKP